MAIKYLKTGIIFHLQKKLQLSYKIVKFYYVIDSKLHQINFQRIGQPKTVTISFNKGICVSVNIVLSIHSYTN